MFPFSLPFLLLLLDKMLVVHCGEHPKSEARGSSSSTSHFIMGIEGGASPGQCPGLDFLKKNPCNTQKCLFWLMCGPMRWRITSDPAHSILSDATCVICPLPCAISACHHTPPGLTGASYSPNSFSSTSCLIIGAFRLVIGTN